MCGHSQILDCFHPGTIKIINVATTITITVVVTGLVVSETVVVSLSEVILVILVVHAVVHEEMVVVYGMIKYRNLITTNTEDQLLWFSDRHRG